MKLNLNSMISNFTIIIAKHPTYFSTTKISCPVLLIQYYIYFILEVFSLSIL